MAEEYSKLEVAPNEHTEPFPEVVDQATHAPERDTAGDAPELDQKSWPLPDLSPSSGTPAYTPSRPDFKHKISDSAPEFGSPDPNYDPDKDRETLKEAGSPPLPQTPSGNIESHLEVSSHKEEPGRPQKRRGLLLWIIIGLVGFLVIAIALGVGLGVGLTRRKSSKSSSNSSSSASSAANSTSNAALPHGIYNDSSVSVVALGDGDKRLLFQEGTGSIREALFTQSANSWTSDINNVVATDARNNTPLAALLVNSTGTPFAADTGPVIFLFYITATNQLASKQFISGSWTSRDNFSPTGSPNMTVSTATNHAELCQAFVFYVAQNGSVESLTITPTSADSIVASPGPSLPSSLQGGHVLALAAGTSEAQNVATPQVGVLTSNGSVYYDLYFSFFNNSAWTPPELQTLLVPALPPSEQITYPTSLTLANAYPATATSLPSAPTDAPSNPSLQSASYNESLIGDVDIAQVFVNDPTSLSYTLFGFWVNGSELAAYTTKNIGLSTQPKSNFPYSRLAGAVDGNGSAVLLYHQINGTGWAEDSYNLDGGFFTTSYFEVATQ